MAIEAALVKPVVDVLLALFQQSPGPAAPLGALLGVGAAILMGVGIYRGGVRLDLRRFFRWTGVFIILVAAGLGNLIYHLRSLLPWVARLGLRDTLWGMRTYMVYCLSLSAGLWWSMARADSRPARPDPIQRFLMLTRIVLFFSVLSLFDELYTPDSPWLRVRFLGYLCGFPDPVL